MEGLTMTDLICRMMRCDVMISRLVSQLEIDRNLGDYSGADFLYWQVRGAKTSWNW